MVQKTDTSPVKLGGSPSSRTPAAALVTRPRSPSISAGASQLAAFKDKHGWASVKMQRLTSGARVQHPTRGVGTVVKIGSNERRSKPYKVRFDSGEVHHYSEETSNELQVTRFKYTTAAIKSEVPSSKARASWSKPRNVVAAASVFREGRYQDAPSEPTDRDGESSVVADGNKAQTDNGECLRDSERTAAAPQRPDSMPELLALSQSSPYSASPPLQPRSPQRDLCAIELTAVLQSPEQDMLKSQSSEACQASAAQHCATPRTALQRGGRRGGTLDIPGDRTDCRLTLPSPSSLTPNGWFAPLSGPGCCHRATSTEICKAGAPPTCALPIY